MPAGRYLISYEAYLVTTDGSTIGNCYLYNQLNGTGSNYRYAGEGSAPNAYGGVSVSGAGYVVHNYADITGLTCRVGTGTFSAGTNDWS